MTALSEAVATFRRAPLLSALGIVTIAFSLFAFGLFGLVALNIRDALRKVEEHVEIRAFISDGTPIEAVTGAMGDIGAFPEVSRVEYVSPEQALVRARQELGEFSDVFEAGILPASIDVRLKPGFRDPKTVTSVAERIKSYEFIDDARYGQEWVEKLYRIRTIATMVGSGLGLAFAVVAIIIIGATIRIMVLARAKEISIMRLVGRDQQLHPPPLLIGGVHPRDPGWPARVGDDVGDEHRHQPDVHAHRIFRHAYRRPWVYLSGALHWTLGEHGVRGGEALPAAVTAVAHVRGSAGRRAALRSAIVAVCLMLAPHAVAHAQDAETRLRNNREELEQDPAGARGATAEDGTGCSPAFTRCPTKSRT